MNSDYKCLITVHLFVTNSLLLMFLIVTSVSTYTSMMGISTEDKCLIKSLRENKKYGAKRLLKLYPSKNCSLVGLKALIKKLTIQVLLFDIMG